MAEEKTNQKKGGAGKMRAPILLLFSLQLLFSMAVDAEQQKVPSRFETTFLGIVLQRESFVSDEEVVKEFGEETLKIVNDGSLGVVDSLLLPIKRAYLSKENLEEWIKDRVAVHRHERIQLKRKLPRDSTYRDPLVHRVSDEEAVKGFSDHVRSIINDGSLNLDDELMLPIKRMFLTEDELEEWITEKKAKRRHEKIFFKRKHRVVEDVDRNDLNLPTGASK